MSIEMLPRLPESKIDKVINDLKIDFREIRYGAPEADALIDTATLMDVCAKKDGESALTVYEKILDEKKRSWVYRNASEELTRLVVYVCPSDGGEKLHETVVALSSQLNGLVAELYPQAAGVGK
jgi:hypothetical protein